MPNTTLTTKKSGTLNAASDSQSGHSARGSLHKILGSMLGASTSSDGGSVPTDAGTSSVFPWHRSASVSRNPTRPPSPALSDDFSVLFHPTREDADDLRTHSELYERMRSRVSVDVPGCAPFVARHHRSQSRGPKKVLAQLKDSFGSIRVKRKGKIRGPLVDENGDLLPLDGEEGELIDDEACFVEEGALRSITIDLISLLPVEISLYILLFLDFSSILKCHLVRRYWHQIASDNLVWRDLFYRQQGWRINRTVLAEQLTAFARSTIAFPPPASDPPSDPSLGPPTPPRQHRASIIQPNRRLSILFEPALDIERPTHSLAMDWMALYRERLRLQRSWDSGAPKITGIEGHEDSVYCIEFDNDKIVTGSRDRTIKVWSLHTYRLRQTIHGHDGSVLCLKFESSGFMVSGSSDRTVFVWDLNGGVMKHKLLGHRAGVLDVRFDKDWIVSCAKDATIHVWSRKTFELHCVLRGHEGAVNALGLQDGKIVSVSGDGNIILWDIATQGRIRTISEPGNGIACVTIHGNIIISGATDSLIKVWSASTGERLLTLSGHDRLVRALAYDPYTGRLVSTSYDRSIKVWDVTRGKLLRDFKDVHPDHVFDVKMDASRIISTSHADKIQVLDFSPNIDTSVFL